MKSLLISIIAVTTTHKGYSQNEVFIDERDSSVYELFQCGNYTWFKQDLRYCSDLSWCNEAPNDTVCLKTNYYHYKEINSVYPTGWCVPKASEWNKMIEIVAAKGGVPKDSLKWETDTFHHQWEIIIGMDSLLRDSNNIHLKGKGWIEGRKRSKINSNNNYWVVGPNGNNPPPHVHSKKVIIYNTPTNITYIADLENRGDLQLDLLGQMICQQNPSCIRK